MTAILATAPPRALWKPAIFDPKTHPAPRRRTIRNAWCMNVVDADTIDALIENGGNEFPFWRIRLAGRDAPEIHQMPGRPKITPAELELGLKAKAFVESVCLNKGITVDIGYEAQTDGRFIGTVMYYVRDESIGKWLPRDLGDELAARKLLKSDVVNPP